MQDEGYIKFQLEWKDGPSPNSSEVASLQSIREILYEKQWIGFDPQLNVGFGNISSRCAAPSDFHFLITGTQTGQHAHLRPEHFTYVSSYDFQANSLTCTGPIQASSESMTHAAAYEASSEIGAVIHIHEINAWKRLMHQIPTTSESITYGTPEMAFAVKDLLSQLDNSQPQVIVMGGHEAGLLATDAHLDIALEHLVKVMEG